MPTDFDVLIVGGGINGSALARALAASPLEIGLVEPTPPAAPAPDWDARIYALTPAVQRFLDTIGAWPHLDADRIAPVTRMRIEGDAGGRLDFTAFAAGVERLASICEAGRLAHELWEGVRRQHRLTLFAGARPAALALGDTHAALTLEDGRRCTARLVVGADGADSWLRQAAGIGATPTPYGELGVVANFRCQHPHADTAFQWFRPDGVLAWLPLPGRRLSMVWSVPEPEGRALLALEPAVLAARVAAAGAHRLGHLETITPPAAFPLRSLLLPRRVAARVALIGDAAHVVHPLTGHGVNLGLQDARVLAQVLCSAARHVASPPDCGDPRLLRRYERRRSEEVTVVHGLTHGLHELFRARARPLVPLRNLGMNLVARMPVVTHFLARYAMGHTEEYKS